MIFDLQQQILQCWTVTEDVKLVEEMLESSTLNPEELDRALNLLQGIRAIYDARFDRLWKTFEGVCGEYYKLKKAL